VLLKEFFGVGAFFPRFFVPYVLPAISLFLEKVLFVRTRARFSCVFSGACNGALLKPAEAEN
jgi:hypothetical protein